MEENVTREGNVHFKVTLTYMMRTSKLKEKIESKYFLNNLLTDGDQRERNSSTCSYVKIYMLIFMTGFL